MSRTFDIEARLEEVQARTLGVDMPIPLHERIDQLCDAVYSAGHARPSKKKMLAALVLASPIDGQELDAMVRAYDGAHVRDALAIDGPAGDVVEFPNRRSGPRPKPA
jgi:hypothetical protein